MMQFSILLLKCQCDNYVDFGILTDCLITYALFLGKRMLSCYIAEFSTEIYGCYVHGSQACTHVYK